MTTVNINLEGVTLSYHVDYFDDSPDFGVEIEYNLTCVTLNHPKLILSDVVNDMLFNTFGEPMLKVEKLDEWEEKAVIEATRQYYKDKYEA